MIDPQLKNAAKLLLGHARVCATELIEEIDKLARGESVPFDDDDVNDGQDTYTISDRLHDIEEALRLAIKGPCNDRDYVMMGVTLNSIGDETSPTNDQQIIDALVRLLMCRCKSWVKKSPRRRRNLTKKKPAKPRKVK